MSGFWLQHGGVRLPVPNGHRLLGRGPQCWFVLAAPGISREHARVRLRDGRLAVQDLASLNGVRVNGETVSGWRELGHGDVIELGGERILVFEGTLLPREPDTQSGVPVVSARPPGLSAQGAQSREETWAKAESWASPTSLSTGSPPGVPVGGGSLAAEPWAEPSLGVTAQRQVLELAEELLRRGANSSERAAIGQTIGSLLDSLDREFARQGRQLSDSELTRLLSVGQIASTWVDESPGSNANPEPPASSVSGFAFPSTARL
jgi:predicted component of type VI protein secretion system